MSRIKRIHVPLEELLDIVSNDTRDNSNVNQFNQDSDTKIFISVFRLRKGRKKVPFSFLYRVYRFWSLNPQNKSVLGRSLTDKFKKIRGKYETYYLLSNTFNSSFRGNSNRGRATRKRKKPSSRPCF